MRRQLVLEPDQAALLVLSDQEAHDHRALAWARGGVDVLDARDLREQALHGLGDARLDLPGGGAGHAHEHVDHGHDDLRLFLAGKAIDGQRPETHRGHDQEGRQLGRDEGPREPTRRAERAERAGGSDLGRLVHSRTSIRAPSTSPAGGAVRTVSPGSRPASTSTDPPWR